MKDSKRFSNNHSSFIIVSGYVVNISGGQTIINSPTAGIFSVKWKGKLLPDGVEIGRRVTFMGRIITLELARSFLIISAELLDLEALKDFKRFFHQRRMKPEE